MEINKLVAIGAGIVLVGSLAWTGIAQDNANNSADALQAASNALLTLEAENTNLGVSVEQLNNDLAIQGIELVDLRTTTEAQAAADAQIMADYETERIAYEAELAAIAEEDATAAEIEVIAKSGYDVDEFGLAETLSEDITENDYEKLLDSEVRFDGDDYDFEEVFSFTATSDINGDDYNAETYLTLDEGDMIYNLVFDSDLDTSLISDDETLEINFLGKEMEITNWNVDEITIETGELFLVNVGESITYNDKIVTLSFAGSDKIVVDVDGEMESINEDETEDVNGLSIKADFTAEGEMASIKVSDADVETTIESGDEFAEDSMWEYRITANEIGLVLTEDFTDIDEDSDYKALAAGEMISLPNEYLSLEYNGIKDVDMVDVDFSEKNGFVKIKGDFANGMDDFDLIYANATGFYDEDYALISTDNIEIDNTDSLIELVGNTLVIEDVELNMDFSDAIVNGNSIVNKDDNYRSSFGIIIDSPEDNLEDEEFSIVVPEEKLEVSITVN